MHHRISRPRRGHRTSRRCSRPRGAVEASAGTPPIDAIAPHFPQLEILDVIGCGGGCLLIGHGIDLLLIPRLVRRANAKGRPWFPGGTPTAQGAKG